MKHKLQSSHVLLHTYRPYKKMRVRGKHQEAKRASEEGQRCVTETN